VSLVVVQVAPLVLAQVALVPEGPVSSRPTTSERAVTCTCSSWSGSNANTRRSVSLLRMRTSARRWVPKLGIETSIV
jgi:hypothetical protein